MTSCVAGRSTSSSHGDAACAFNPIYGQEMTAGAEAARLLHVWLQAGEPARAFQRLGKWIATPWLQAAGEDFRYPTTEGASLVRRLARRYPDRLLAISTVDETVARAVRPVLHLLAPPSVLLHPAILTRAVRGPGRPLLLTPPTATPLHQPLDQMDVQDRTTTIDAGVVHRTARVDDDGMLRFGHFLAHDDAYYEQGPQTIPPLISIPNRRMLSVSLLAPQVPRWYHPPSTAGDLSPL